MALTPLIVTVVILLVTRIPILGLRGLLTSPTPNLPISLGRLGEITISPSLVVQLRNILGQGLDWSYAVLYGPSISPFLFTAVLAFLLFRSPMSALPDALHAPIGRIGKPVIALFGALVFVNLLDDWWRPGVHDNTRRCAGECRRRGLEVLAPFLGALGSFFSGSTTISNLTFGGIQASIAQDTGLDVGTLLALQCAGAAMGNMITIHNIVAVCAVLACECRRRDPQESLSSGHPLRHHARSGSSRSVLAARMIN